MLHVALYARVSSDQQKEEHTIESQVQALQDEALRRGATVPDPWVFRDEGCSGATLNRPGLEALRDRAAEGQFTHLLVYAPDRLARNYALQVFLLDEFARHGVEVEFLRAVRGDSPEAQLLLQFQGMIAEYERTQILERSRRGKLHKARQGSVTVLAGAPYGYHYGKATSASPARYEILPDEAEVVRHIYTWYTQDGLAIGAITRRLTERCIPTRTGQLTWSRSSVREILRNPAYKGTACYGKTQTTTLPVKRTRKVRLRGEYAAQGTHEIDTPVEQWIAIPVPPIIEESTFQWAQERRAINRQQAARRTITPSLLQSLLVCERCGYALYRSSTRTSSGQKIYYYRCFGGDEWRFPDGRRCDRRPIRQDLLDGLVWEQLVNLLETPALIEAELSRRAQAARTSSVSRQRQEQIQHQVDQLEQQMQRLLTAYQEDLLSLETLRERMPALKTRVAAAQAERQLLETACLEEEHLRAISTSVQEFLTSLHQRIATLTLEEKQQIVRILVKEVIVGEDFIRIDHSIPIHPLAQKKMLPKADSYLLCPRSVYGALYYSRAIYRPVRSSGHARLLFFHPERDGRRLPHSAG